MSDRLVDALCRVACGRRHDEIGSEDDFDAATRLIQDRAREVSGSFRRPTDAERYQKALKEIAGGRDNAVGIARDALS